MATAAFSRQAVRENSFVKSRLIVIYLCFIASGATGLIYEILWARMLGLVFGATTFAVSAVLAAFMGGLALGSAVTAKSAQRIRRPFRVYGILEIGVALYALTVPFLFTIVDKLYALIWSSMSPGLLGFNLLRFVLSCMVLVIPTALMGATLPVLSSGLIRTEGFASTHIARLYTFNLGGAVFGTLVAGFILLPMLGVRSTIYLAALINCLIGVAAIAVGGSVDNRPTSDTDETLSGSVETNDKLKSERASTFLWLSAAAISGFVTISTQVAWTRLLTMIIGSSTYAFSVVVALFLIGLAAGSFVMSRSSSDVNIRRLLLKAEIGTCIAFVYSLWVTNRIPEFLVDKGLSWQIGSWSGLLLLQISAAALLILFPAFLMGMVMPLVLLWAGRKADYRDSVSAVGKGYAVNTIGAIAGAWATAFVLIPMLSTRSTILIAASLCLAVAWIAYEPQSVTADRDVRRSFAAGLVALLIVGLFVLAPRMNKQDLSVGAYDTVVRVLARSQNAGAQEEEQRGEGEHRVLMFEEGPTATISVRQDWGITSMAVNGRTNASDSEKGDMPTQVMLAQIPMLLAPRIDKSLVVGFGSGVSVGSMLQAPIKSLECVELERSAIDAGHYFDHVNNKPLDDPRLHMIIDDARTYLRVTRNKYDVIVSEPSHPWVPGVANLFTKDFFELGHSRLAEQGVFVQWVQIYQLSTSSLKTVLATYQSVFPHVLVFQVGGHGKGKDLILVGSDTPIGFDHLQERLSDSRISKDIARVGLHNNSDVMQWFVCDERTLSPSVAGAPINTDDNMLVENRVPREAFLPLMETNSSWIEDLAASARKAGT